VGTKVDQLKEFREADWAGIWPKLITYAEGKIAGKRWNSGGTLPKGFEAPDLVGLVIQKTLDGILGENPESARNWNEKVDPELIDHLKSAIDSETSNLVRSNVHKKTDRIAMDDTAGTALVDKALLRSRPSNSPEDLMLENEGSAKLTEKFENFYNRLLEEVAGNDNASLVLMSFRELAEGDENVKPQLVAKQLQMPIGDVYSAIKVIRRAADKLREFIYE